MATYGTQSPPDRNSTNCTLEPVPKAEIASTYIYSVPDHSTPYAASITLPAQHERHETTHDAPPTPRRSKWTRWFLLLVYGFAVAAAAGVAGGFIGKAMSDKHLHNSKQDATPSQPQQTSCPPTSTTNSISNQNSSTPSSTITPVFARTIPVPTTGCVPLTTQHSFKSFTLYLDVSYTTLCMTGWQRDELFALSAATPSDCIEACVMYNGHKSNGERSCVGGGFIPEWWNQSKAMGESGGMPYNCFLKSGDGGVGRNDRDFEVVSLCMEGACQGALG